MTGHRVLTVHDDSWRDQAACIGTPSELWFPMGPAQVVARANREAKAICAYCPVRAACLADVRRWDQFVPYGTRGGMTADERAACRPSMAAHTFGRLSRNTSGPGGARTPRDPANDVEVADMPNGTAAVNPAHNGGR